MLGLVSHQDTARNKPKQATFQTNILKSNSSTLHPHSAAAAVVRMLSPPFSTARTAALLEATYPTTHPEVIGIAERSGCMVRLGRHRKLILTHALVRVITENL